MVQVAAILAFIIFSGYLAFKAWIQLLVFLTSSSLRCARILWAFLRSVALFAGPILIFTRFLAKIFPQSRIATYSVFIARILAFLFWNRRKMTTFLHDYKALENLPTVHLAMQKLRMRSIYDYFWRHDRMMRADPARTSALQKPYIYVPGPRAKPFWDAAEIPGIDILEKRFAEIRDEFLNAPQHKFTKPYVNETGLYFDPNSEEKDADGRPRYNRDDWQVIFFWRGGDLDAKVADAFPVTFEILKSIPNLDENMICFSRLKPNRWIPPHCGLTNAVLRIHLPIIAPLGCSIQVGDQTKDWMEGKLLIFDDAYYHQVWNRSTEDRVVLLLNVIHPDFTQSEANILNKFFTQSMRNVPTHTAWRES